jgi:hypothetical protein
MLVSVDQRAYGRIRGLFQEVVVFHPKAPYAAAMGRSVRLEKVRRVVTSMVVGTFCLLAQKEKMESACLSRQCL